MRQRTPVYRSGITAAAALAVLSGPTPAAAQGFLETLFGVFAPKPQIQTPSRDGSLHLGNPFDSRRRRLSYSGGGSYKTVCVRLCDGFYFPISNAVSRHEFYRDAVQCQAQCQSDARLFYMPKNAGSIETARDQTGLYYEELRNAFLYRKKLDKSCSCRPAPWSDAEHQRHERYASVEAGRIEQTETAARGDNDLTSAEPGVIDENRHASTGEGGDPYGPWGPQRVVMQRRYVPMRPPPKQPVPQPAFGLGGLFSASSGNGHSPSAKPFKNKFRWPGDDGN